MNSDGHGCFGLLVDPEFADGLFRATGAFLVKFTHEILPRGRSCRGYSQKVTEKLAYNQVKHEILRLVVTDPTHLFYTTSILHCMFQTNRQANMVLIETLIFLAADHA